MIRILIAEDNDLVSLTLEEQLKGLGYDVAGIARSGTEAVSLAARLRPDLIIMDIRMPEMEGTEAAARIRDHAPVPIIMLTAYADNETIKRAEAAGALGYLVKPINENELTPAIRIALARFKEFTDIRQIQLSGAAFPENIVCDRLILFESRLAPEGPTYFSVAEYPLGK